ncbi:MAG: ATP-binding cassette domain-containing protein [archaeon]|nr:ATP-binding cassette domain-containing protein [archaeon]
MLLKAQSVSKSFGPQKVLTDVSLQINEGDRIGLVGANGAGKSTFLKILLGEEKEDTGEITRRTEKIGYMQQFVDIPEDMTVREVLEQSFSYAEHIKVRMAEIDEMYSSGGDIDWNALAEEQSELESKLQKFNSEIGDKLLDVLKQVNFPEEYLDREMGSLSGGEKSKVMMARTVVQVTDCDLIFMDEPTSHLDISTIEWMERLILGSKCAVVIVSHDRYFLDRIALRVLEIENGKSQEYKGNYSDYVDKKNMALERQMKEYERYADAKKKQDALIEAMFHDARRYMGSYKTRIMMASKLEEKERPDEQKDININIKAAQKSGKNVLMAEDVSVSRDGKTILSGINLDIQKGDKIGIFGANGAGKSTLLKAILGELPVTGDLWVAPGAKIGYYSQQHEGLDLKLTAEEQMLHLIGPDNKAEARRALAQFLLTDENVTKKMESLSGGQRAKVALCLMMHGETNLLILDEPTNYVDINSKHMLEQALAEYDGVVITVTHDRYFLDNVCNKVIEVGKGKAICHNGNYTDLKGAPEPVKIAEKATMYRCVEPFTNWTTRKKYAKGDRIAITPSEMPGFQDALDKGKIRKS